MRQHNYTIDLDGLERDIRERAHNKISQYIELYEKYDYNKMKDEAVSKATNGKITSSNQLQDENCLSNAIENDISNAGKVFGAQLALSLLNLSGFTDYINSSSHLTYKLAKNVRDKADHMIHLIREARQAENNGDYQRRDAYYELIEMSLKTFDM
ncbi:hypothetical protein D1872_37560 [compost metagenome]